MGGRGAASLRYNGSVRIVAEKTLRSYWANHADVEEPLRFWIQDTRLAEWLTPRDVKADYAAVSILPNDRVCFNIKENDYRLIVSINYFVGVVYIKWVGTHAEYDRIDATTVGAT